MYEVVRIVGVVLGCLYRNGIFWIEEVIEIGVCLGESG